MLRNKSLKFLNACIEDLLLENLFAIPRQMQYEFSIFGFLY